MEFARRLRLDFNPAFFALLALGATLEFCSAYSGGETLWVVDSAHRTGLAVIGFWWIWSDALRRRFPLHLVWGLWMCLAGSVVLVVYLFVSRGWWALVTLFLYFSAILLAGRAVGALA